MSVYIHMHSYDICVLVMSVDYLGLDTCILMVYILRPIHIRLI